MRAVLEARHRVADAHCAVSAVANHLARALAWQHGDEAAVVANLEAALQRLAPAQRMLHEAILELRQAMNESGGAEVRPEMTDAAFFSLGEDRRKAILLWEMFGRPMGDDGIRILQQAVEQSTNEQILTTLRQLQQKA